MFDDNRGNDTFFEAMQIHAVCLDAKIDDEKIRLLTYMHFKIKANGDNLDYFEQASEQDITSIEIMLGNKAPLESMLKGKRSSKRRVVEAIILDHSNSTIENIKRLDGTFRKDLGIENRLSGELRNRLRLYRDRAFRKEMVQLYEEIIAPRIDLYEMVTINRAFKQAREREESETAMETYI